MFEPPTPRPPERIVARLLDVRRRVDPAALRGGLEELPAPRDRRVQPEAAARTERILLDRFAEAGWDVERQPFDERDGHRRYGLFRQGVPDLAGVNIVATRPGTGPDAGIVVVGAHHDTLPETPGADDNGASVVALLEVARLLADTRSRDTIVLAAFDHEESGFHGAQAFVDALPRGPAFRGALIYETMAYTSTEPGSQTIPAGLELAFPRQVRRIRERGDVGDWNALIYRRDVERVARRFAGALEVLAGPGTAVLLRDPVDLPGIGPLLPLLPPVRNLARSDHIPFWAAGLGAIQITDTANFRNPHYHLPSDTPETVDYERLADIVAATVVTLEVTAGTVHRAGAG